MSRSKWPVSNAVLTALLCAVAGTSLAAKGGGGKPGGDPPPPPPPVDGAKCADSTGEFPALVYFDLVKEGTGKKNVQSIFHLYVANSDNSCSIEVWSGEDGPLFTYSYRQIGGEGQVVWSRGVTINRIRFDVADRAITTLLPFASPETVFVNPVVQNAGITQAILSPAGDEIYFDLEQADPVVSWMDSVNAIDLASCTSLPCSAAPILTWANRGFGGLSVSADGSRIYMRSHDRVPDIYGVSFIEKLSNGGWSALKDVVTSNDAGYAQSRFGSGGAGIGFTSTALVDYGAGPTEVLAFNREDGRDLPTHLDIMMVGDCDVTLPETCLANGDASLSGAMVPGQALQFTSLTAQLAVPPPTLLIYSDAGATEEWDPRSVSKIREILPGIPGMPVFGD